MLRHVHLNSEADISPQITDGHHGDVYQERLRQEQSLGITLQEVRMGKGGRE